MNPPDLQSLKAGQAEAWDVAFQWLWPVVFAVAQLKLQPFIPNEIEEMWQWRHWRNWWRKQAL